MKTIKASMFVAFFIFIGQNLFTQTVYVGSIDLNKKKNSFSLVSSSDSLLVKIDKKKLEFNAQKDFFFIKTRRDNYQLVYKGDTVKIKDSKKQIEFSTGLIFFVAKKKSKNLILLDKNGKTMVNAKYEIKKHTAYYSLEIFENRYLKELLAYSSYYLYTQSKNQYDSNNYYYLMYLYTMTYP